MKLNKNMIISFIVVIGCTFIFNYTFNRPTVINKYIATHVFSSPANTAFTDNNFYQCVIDNYNKENSTSLAYTTILSDTQLQSIQKVDCTSKNIQNAKGIEKLAGLKYADLMFNQITSIDISDNKHLLSFEIGGNNLTSLDVSQNNSLLALHASANQLSSIDLSNNKSLNTIELGGNNLKELNLIYNTEVKILDVSQNELSLLDISKNTSLKELEVDSNLLTELDTSNNNLLEKLIAYENKIATLDLSNNNLLKKLDARSNLIANLVVNDGSSLESVNMGYNQLNELNITNAVSLKDVYASENNISRVDISGSIALENLNLENNQLTDINLNDSTKLEYLNISSNQLSTIDLSNNQDLLIVDINHNNLTELNIDNNHLITRLEANNNQLNELNLSENKSLETLYIYDNNLTSLDLNNASLLKTLRSQRNQLMSINLIDASALEELNVSYNQLTELDISNKVVLTTLDFTENPLVKLNASGATSITELTYSNSDLQEVNVNGATSLESLSIRSAQLTNLNVKGATALEYLAISDNNLEELDITDNTALRILEVGHNLLTEIDVSNNPLLTKLDLQNYWASDNSYHTRNQISNLNLENNSQLQYLRVGGNALEELDVSQNTLLIELSAGGNNLTEIDVSNLTNLNELVIDRNKLTKLDLNKNIYLKEVNAEYNNLNNINLEGLTSLEKLYLENNKLTKLNIKDNIALTTLDVENNLLTDLDASNNTLLAKFYIDNNNFSKIIAAYKNDKMDFKNEATKIISLPNDYTLTMRSVGTQDGFSVSNIIHNDEFITFLNSEEYNINIDYSHNIHENNNYYHNNYLDIDFNIYVIEATSDKYDINAEEGYIYTGIDTDTEMILNNINLNYGEASIENNQVLIKYEGELVKTFDLVNISSDIYDLSKDYIFEYEENGITINNGTINKNTENNTIEIKYNDIVLDTYNLVEVSSETYDLSGTSVGVKDNTINGFISDITCTNCEAKVYDGTNYLTEGTFSEKDYTLRIMYGKEILKEYELTFPVSGVELNKESIRLGLLNKNSYQLEASVIPSKAENHAVTWETSNEDVATVDDNGLVTSVGLGTTTITVTTEEGGFTDIAEVEVVDIITYAVNYTDEDKTYTEYYEEDEEVILKSDIIKEGYTLVGWEYNDICYQLTDKIKMPSEDIELIAVWNANEYEVTYENLDSRFNVTYDSPYGELLSPTKKGHTFNGWYLEETFDTKITEDTVVTTAEDHTLYAKFDINSYKLTIDSNGGDYVYEDELTVNYNEEITLEEPTRVGYTFKGWEVTGEESAIDDNKFTMGISDSTLIAKWEIIIPDIETTSEYVLKNNMLTNIPLETNINELNLGLDEIYTTKIVSNKEKEYLGTGDKVQIYLEDTLVVEYVVVVKGDVSGDGKANVADYSKAYQYYKKRITMEEYFIEASDVVKNDTVITMADVSKIYQFIKKRISSLD